MGFSHFAALFLVGALIVPASVEASPDDTQSPQPRAVDDVNGKVSGLGSTNRFGNVYGVDGSVSFPLGHSFGLQLDGLVSKLDTDRLGQATAYGAGAHVFWRNPGKGLLGLYGHYGSTDLTESANFRAIGLEAEAYLDRFTLTALIGAEDGRFVSSEIGELDFGTNFFSSAFLIYYPIDNLGLTIGHRYVLEQHSVTAGAEWGLRGNQNTSLYSTVSYSEDNHTSATLGVRYYIGKTDKPLILRHREDDPVQTPILWVLEQAVGDLDNIIKQYREFHGS